MNCSSVQSIIQEYFEGRLSRLDRNEFVSHVAECAACEDEVVAYRGIFAGLGDMGHYEVPSRVKKAVMAHLQAEGAIRTVRERVSVLDRFVALPGFAKYPLAAAVVIAALYVPLAALLGLARGSVGSVTGAIADGHAAVQAALGGVSVIAGFVDALSTYARALMTVANAVSSFVSGGDTTWVLSAGAVAVLGAVLVYLVVRRKRSIHHATFGF